MLSWDLGKDLVGLPTHGSQVGGKVLRNVSRKFLGDAGSWGLEAPRTWWFVIL